MTSSSANKPEISFLYISDEAWEGLVTQARQANYVRGERVWGLTKWMIALLLANPSTEMWEDKRPRPIQEGIEDMLERGALPSWDMGDYRRARCLSGFPVEARNLSAQLALNMGILKAVSFKRATVTSTLASQLWEAIGLKWLSPKENAPPPNYKKEVHKKRKDDYAWF